VSFPVLPRERVHEFVSEVLIQEDLNQSLVDDFLDRHAQRVPTLDTTPAASVGARLHAAAVESGLTDDDLEPVESQFSGAVFDAMMQLPLEALGSVDFWTYVSAKHFWGFVVLRQRNSVIRARRKILDRILAPTTPDPEVTEGPLPLERYVLGKDHYQIPLRLFLRAQAVGGDQRFLDENLVTAAPTDFWRSHVLGVRTGAYPNWARPLVAAQADQGLVMKAQREPAKAINRLRANLSPVLHTEAEAGALVTPLWTG
jgi:hypothetical protein